jgi:hypothetical protein
MNRKAFGIAAALTALVWTGTVAFAQRQSAPASLADCPAEGFQGASLAAVRKDNLRIPPTSPP